MPGFDREVSLKSPAFIEACLSRPLPAGTTRSIRHSDVLIGYGWVGKPGGPGAWDPDSGRSTGLGGLAGFDVRRCQAVADSDVAEPGENPQELSHLFAARGACQIVGDEGQLLRCSRTNSQAVADRAARRSRPRSATSAHLTFLPISHIMSTKPLHIASDESILRPYRPDRPPRRNAWSDRVGA